MPARSYSRSRSRSPSRSASRSRSRSSSRRSETPPKKDNGYARNSQRDDPAPNKVLGVFGLSPDTDERKLHQHFGNRDFGPVDDIKLIRDKLTDRSRCFAFIYYRDIRDATAARNKKNWLIDGREVRVDYSCTKGPHTSGSRRSSDYSPRRSDRRDNDTPTTNRCIGCFNLSPETNERDLEERFSKFGPIETIRIITDHVTGRQKGFAFIYYDSVDSAIKAKNDMDGRSFNGSQIRVDFSATNAKMEGSRGGSDRRQRRPEYSDSYRPRRERSRSPRRSPRRSYSPRRR